MTFGGTAKRSMQAFETGALFDVAVKAARNITAPLREGGQRDALVSIVFSVVSLEAFVNELTELAIRWDKTDKEASVVSVFARCMEDAEKGHASLESKLILAHWILKTQKFDRGSKIFQNLSLLIDLRNDLVHFKPNEEICVPTTPDEAHKKLIGKFSSLHILCTDAPVAALVSWTYLIQTKAAAGWACATAARVVRDFCGNIPESLLKESAQRFATHFTGEWPLEPR